MGWAFSLHGCVQFDPVAFCYVESKPMTFNPVKTFFKSLGVALVSAGIAFFTANFLAIIALVIYQAFSHRTPDYSIAYRVVGTPVGLLAFLVAFTVMFVRDVKNARQ
jgi:uncharacterized BrkB/YihY/UPF0761 family membrane protein